MCKQTHKVHTFCQNCILYVSCTVAKMCLSRCSKWSRLNLQEILNYEKKNWPSLWYIYVCVHMALQGYFKNLWKMELKAKFQGRSLAQCWASIGTLTSHVGVPGFESWPGCPFPLRTNVTLWKAAQVLDRPVPFREPHSALGCWLQPDQVLAMEAFGRMNWHMGDCLCLFCLILCLTSK